MTSIYVNQGFKNQPKSTDRFLVLPATRPSARGVCIPAGLRFAVPSFRRYIQDWKVPDANAERWHVERAVSTACANTLSLFEDGTRKAVLAAAADYYREHGTQFYQLLMLNFADSVEEIEEPWMMYPVEALAMLHAEAQHEAIAHLRYHCYDTEPYDSGPNEAPRARRKAVCSPSLKELLAEHKPKTTPETAFEVPSYDRASTWSYEPPTVAQRTEWKTRRLVRRFQRMQRRQQARSAPVTRTTTPERQQPRLSLQSGKETPVRTTKAQRDAQRAAQAKHDAEVRRKSRPKAEREKAVKQARDKRSPVLQSGLFLGGVLATAGLQVARAAKKLFRKAEKTSEAFTGLAEKLGDFVQGLKKALGNALWRLPLAAVLCYVAWMYRTRAAIVVPALSAALAAVAGPQLRDAIIEFFPRDEMRLQSGVLDDLKSALPKVCAAAMVFSVLGAGRRDVTSELGKRLSGIERLATGWEAFMKWTLKALEVSVNFLLSRFSDKRVTLLQDSAQPAHDWCKEVTKFVADDIARGDEVPLNPKRIDELVKLVVRGSEFKTIYHGTPMERVIAEHLQVAMVALMPYQGSLTARNNFRVEPVMMMLYGRPGIGKTLLAMQIASAVMLVSGLAGENPTKEDVLREVWQKGNSEYWNGYCGQSVLVMDDAFQSRADLADKENDYMSIIRMVSSWSFPLNFADLASKGKIYFGSKFIYGTTNLRSINSEARIVIQEPSAVLRRIRYPLALRVISEYLNSNQELDYDKFRTALATCQKEGAGMERFPWFIWEVATHDYETGFTGSDWRPLGEVVLEIGRSIKARIEEHDQARSLLDDFITGFKFQSQGESIVSEDVRVAHANLVTRARSMMGACWKDINDMRRDASLVKRALGAFLTGAIGGLAIVAVKALLSGFWTLITGIFGAVTGRNKLKLHSNRPATSIRVQTRKVKAQAGAIELQSTDEGVLHKVYENGYKMHTVLESGKTYIFGTVTFIGDTLAMFPKHFYDEVSYKINSGELAPDRLINFRHATVPGHNFTLSAKNFVSGEAYAVEGTDVMFYKFKEVRAHRNIVAHFLTEKDIDHVKGRDARLDIIDIDSDNAVVPTNKRRQLWVPQVKYVRELKADYAQLGRCFEYRACTTGGDCGAPLTLMNGASFAGRAIMGFHNAGSVWRGIGISCIITREMVDAALTSMGVIKDRFEEDLVTRGVLVSQAGLELPFEGNNSFLPIGKASRPVNRPSKTKYYVTKHWGSLGEHKLRPAPLSAVYRNGVLVEPMINALKPYATPVRTYEQAWLKQAVHVALTPAFEITRNRSRRIYTFEEAVLGIPEAKFRAIPRGTSAGYPYSLDATAGKKDFFGDKADYDLTSDIALMLRARVDDIITAARRNERLSHVFTDFLKDELRTEAKVEAVATRLISAAPLDYTIAWRMYHGAFTTAIMENSVVTGMAPGVSSTSEWDKVARMVTAKGPQLFDGDFKSFDASEQVSIFVEICEAVNRWYDDGEENARIRRVLWLDLYHSRHIGGVGNRTDIIYQWNKSLPSGHPFTTIVNSIYSLTLIVGSYISITGDTIGFWKNVSAVTYGDDNVVNPSEEIADVFNQQTVAEAMMREFGVVYTSGQKDGELHTTFDISKATFLKRRFVYEDGHWLAPLELESFLYTHYWWKNTKNEKDKLPDVLENALEELSLHDSKTWNAYAGQLEKLLLEERGYTAAVVEQSEYRKLVLARSDNWY